MSVNEKRTVLVTGDVVRDAHLYGGVKTTPVSAHEPGTGKDIRPGGAALCLDLLQCATAAEVGNWQAEEEKWNQENDRRRAEGLKLQERPENHPDFPPEYHTTLGIDLGDPKNNHLSFLDALPTSLHSFGVWTPHPGGPVDQGESVWRISTEFGYGPASDGDHRFNLPSALTDSGQPDEAPSLILIDDGGIVFRHDRNEEAWPDLNRPDSSGALPTVVLKMSNPLCRGDLYPYLVENAADRLVVIVSADDLREGELLIRERLSWEQTVADTLKALDSTFAGGELLAAAHLVVSFGSAGALWIEREGKRHLVFDPKSLEGDFEPQFSGSVYGFQSCLASAVSHQLALSGASGEFSVSKSAMIDGLKSGLSTKRELIRLGHGPVNQPEPGFPCKSLGEAIACPSVDYAMASIPSVEEISANPDWTILDRCERMVGTEHGSTTPYFGLAQLAARIGLDAFSEVPSYAAGVLFSVDRGEIESLRVLDCLIRQYEDGGQQEKPLSIGVFGPPGAGKSFGVKALAKAALGKKVPILEFNLSQFKDPDELVGAFHQIRDKVLEGRTPVAFWDEFDSRQFMWLQYLLAPMQDGAFQEGQITHPIGKCVFVFAGGTSSTFQGFTDKTASEMTDDEYSELSPAEQHRYDKAIERELEFKLLKGPDFASRLHGHLNVLGPNDRALTSPDAPPDLTWPIRRALMLRGLLRLKPEAYLDIDPGLLRALLAVRKFTHGARSFQKIIDGLNIGRRDDGRLVRSALLPQALLTQETDAEDLYRLLDRDRTFLAPDRIERIAAATHAKYTESEAPTESLQKNFKDLPDDKKSANRAAACRIPRLLDLVDFVVVEAEETKEGWKDKLKSAIETAIERLAIAEHSEWCAERRANGWVPGKKRNDERKIHDSLIPWADLSHADREKDRRNVRAIPALLELAEMRAVPAKSESD